MGEGVGGGAGAHWDGTIGSGVGVLGLGGVEARGLDRESRQEVSNPGVRFPLLDLKSGRGC